MPLISGVTHFAEVAFVFHNIAGLGYHYGNPFAGVPQSYIDLSSRMTSMWVSFIHDLDPSPALGNPNWEPYSRNTPRNLVLDAPISVEADTWRSPGIDYLNAVAQAFWR